MRGIQYAVLPRRMSAMATDEIDLDAAQSELDEAAGALSDLEDASGAEWKTLDQRRQWAQAQLDSHRSAGN